MSSGMVGDSLAISSRTGELRIEFTGRAGNVGHAQDISATGAASANGITATGDATFRISFRSTDRLGRETGDATIEQLHAVEDTNNDDILVLLAAEPEGGAERAWLDVNAGMRMQTVSAHIRSHGVVAGINALFSSGDVARLIDFIRAHE